MFCGISSSVASLSRSTSVIGPGLPSRICTLHVVQRAFPPQRCRISTPASMMASTSRWPSCALVCPIPSISTARHESLTSPISESLGGSHVLEILPADSRFPCQSVQSGVIPRTTNQPLPKALGEFRRMRPGQHHRSAVAMP